MAVQLAEFHDSTIAAPREPVRAFRLQTSTQLQTGGAE
jgi:hypothetical protein